MCCPICDCKVYIYLEECDKKYYKCCKCEFIFLSRECMLSKKEEKARYAMHQNNMEDKGYVNMFDCFINDVIFPQRRTIKTKYHKKA